MYPLYKDIRLRLGKPLWVDGNGVPRYDEFEPGMTGIYDDWCGLFWVECQSCRRKFLCGNGISSVHEYIKGLAQGATFTGEWSQDPVAVSALVFSWGDAPWHNDDGQTDKWDPQCAGTTMCYESITPIQYWHKVNGTWQQVELTPEILGQFVEEGNE